MARGFKFKGTTDAKFKQLEIILPRIMANMSTKTYGIIPASIITSYVKLATPNEDIFNGAMFAGKVKKVLFKIGMIEGKETPNYIIRLTSKNNQNKFMAETKKLNHIIEVNVDVNDGDILTINQLTESVNLHSVYISALIELKQDNNTIKEFVTEELLGSIEDERI